MNTATFVAAGIAQADRQAAPAAASASDGARAHAECTALLVAVDKSADGQIRQSEASANRGNSSSIRAFRLDESACTFPGDLMAVQEKAIVPARDAP